MVWVEDDMCDDATEIQVDMQGRNQSDHAILKWSIPMFVEKTNEPRVIRDSKAEERYVKEVQQGLSINDMLQCKMETIEDIKEWECEVETLLQNTWNKHATIPVQSKKAKTWWTTECSEKAQAVKEARNARTQDDSPNEKKRKIAAVKRAQVELKRTTRRAKKGFFDRIIEEMKPQRVWDLVEWTKPCKQNANITLTDASGKEAETAEEVGAIFKEQFVPSYPKQVDVSILEEYPQIPERRFEMISPAEVRDCLKETSNKSAPGPDKCTWRLWKKIINDRTLTMLVKAYNACIDAAYFPKFFKRSITVVIPKPKKPDYSRASAYCPIVLLNCLGKLMEKVLAKRMQFETQKFNITHPCQYGGTMQHSTVDAGIQLVHNIKQAWNKKLDSTVLLLDVSQFFPSLNHGILVGTMQKQGFSKKLCAFMGEYLKDRSTQFLFNGQKMTDSDITVGVGQGSALSPILSGIYTAAVIHKWVPIHMGTHSNMTLQFFVDDSLIHVAAPAELGTYPEAGQLQANGDIATRVFNDLTQDLLRIGLGVEQSKLELMHFRKGRGKWTEDQPLGPSMRLRIGGDHVNAEETTIHPKGSMRYLGFFLDPKLSWREHIRLYTTKASSTVNSVRMLGNSNRGLSPTMKRRLYISNVVPILTYGAQLWWNPGWKGIGWIAKSMAKTQSRAARWITGAFRTTPTGAIEMAAGLLPIKQQVNTYMRKMNLCTHKLHQAHPVRASLGTWWREGNIMTVPFRVGEGRKPATTSLTHINSIAGQMTEKFEPLHEECTPGTRLVDKYAERISWDLDAPKKGSKEWKKWLNKTFCPKLRRIMANPKVMVVFTDGSRKANPEIITGAAWQGYSQGQRVVEGKVGCGRATAFDAEMMALAKGMANATRWTGQTARHIHMFADNKGALQTILSLKLGPSQYLAIQASKTIKTFLERNTANRITLHWCPGHVGVKENEAVDKSAKDALEEVQSEGESWSVTEGRIKREEQQTWKEERRREGYRGSQNKIGEKDENLIVASNKNWFIQKCGKSTKQMAKLVRVITGHLPCGAYRGRFNIPGEEKCACGARSETRDHILRECPLWIRYDPSPFGTFQKIVRQQPRLEDSLDGIRWFVKMNPMAASFEWTELRNLEQEENSLKARRKIWGKMSGWTTHQKEAWEKWHKENPRAGEEKFEWNVE